MKGRPPSSHVNRPGYRLPSHGLQDTWSQDTCSSLGMPPTLVMLLHFITCKHMNERCAAAHVSPHTLLERVSTEISTVYIDSGRPRTYIPPANETTNTSAPAHSPVIIPPSPPPPHCLIRPCNQRGHHNNSTSSILYHVGSLTGSRPRQQRRRQWQHSREPSHPCTSAQSGSKGAGRPPSGQAGAWGL